jgi:hypothetical protein
MSDNEMFAEKKKEAQQFCRKHLLECCSDIRIWHKTGVLPQGRAMELAAIYSTFMVSDDVLMHVEDEVKRQSMDYVLDNPPSSGAEANYKDWYEEAMGASNEAGYAGMDAASVIREMDRVITDLRLSYNGAIPAAWRGKVHLAAQMLTWGDSEGGIMPSQADEMKELQHTLFALLEQRNVEPESDLDTVHAFLLGQGELDGFYFGDSDTARPRERYWWRRYLEEAIATSRKGKENA